MLENLLVENKKIASQLAISRPPPSGDSASSSNHRRKESLSRGDNSGTKSVQEYSSMGVNALISTSFQENNQNESVVAPSVPGETADSTDSNSYEYGNGGDPTNQLLTEYWSSF
ncbi:hypothetical protein B0O99DRAFT_600417 [Bisporella sp. PMI_857]|nr:hypothetical protein B0O99DRAFT_391906 [Bisporella sp. PMI_857]KAH8588912.1 hypothetical protein B0O99DRAFT_600417 [Bisporella sp. PMI_857]